MSTLIYNPQCIDGFSAKLDGRRSVWRQVCQTCAQSGPSSAFHTSGTRARPGPGCRSLPIEESAGSPRQLRRRRLPAPAPRAVRRDVACRASSGARVSRWDAAPMEAWPPRCPGSPPKSRNATGGRDPGRMRARSPPAAGSGIAEEVMPEVLDRIDDRELALVDDTVVGPFSLDALRVSLGVLRGLEGIDIRQFSSQVPRRNRETARVRGNSDRNIPTQHSPTAFPPEKGGLSGLRSWNRDKTPSAGYGEHARCTRRSGHSRPGPLRVLMFQSSNLLSARTA